MTDDIVVRLRRHARVPFEKIERKAAFDAAKRVVKQPNADIVDRLRAIVVVSGGVTNANVDHIVKAADEIERLREELTASHESHGNEVGALTERLSLAIHERDEARREVCEMISDADESSKPESAEQVANRRGWDCCKENTND